MAYSTLQPSLAQSVARLYEAKRQSGKDSQDSYSKSVHDLMVPEWMVKLAS
jgi:hypothetical protein